MSDTKPVQGYEDLKNYFANVDTMFSVRNVLAVDMMTAMPAGGVAQRLKDIASITKRIYAETTSPAVTNLLKVTDASAMKGWDKGNVLEMRRIHKHLAALPPSLYIAGVRTVNEGRRHHKVAMDALDWDSASTYLNDVVELYRKIGALKKNVFGAATSYEALLLGYANDISEDRIEDLYKKLSGPLIGLREEIIAKQGQADAAGAGRELSKGEQVKVTQAILSAMGFDFARGALMVASGSPYAGGTRNDVRVLTRTSADGDYYAFVKDALYQGARALYTQNLPEEWDGQPVGQAQGALIMNAISVLYESVIGRMKEFGEYLTSLDGMVDMDHFTATRRHIRTSVTRGGADEVSKISHDMIRYRIEKDLISGALDVNDLPERWAKESKNFLGVEPSNLSEGCLQNPDWFTGRFGFIPTNTLSHIIAVSLFDQIEKAYPDAKARIKAGKLKFVGAWLTKNVFSKGRSIGAVELMEDLLGEPLNQDRLLSHFEVRYIDGQR